MSGACDICLFIAAIGKIICLLELLIHRTVSQELHRQQGILQRRTPVSGETYFIIFLKTLI